MDRNASWGITYARSRATTSTTYNGSDGRSGKRALRNTASITLHRMAKNTSELTNQVEPNSSEKVTRLRVSSNMKAAPRKNMCALKPRRAGRGASPKISPRAMTATMARPAMKTHGSAGSRRYINGQSSVAGAGGVGSGQDTGAYQRQQDGVRIFVELRCGRADLSEGLVEVRPLRQERLQAGAIDQHPGASPAAVTHRVGR